MASAKIFVTEVIPDSLSCKKEKQLNEKSNAVKRVWKFMKETVTVEPILLSFIITAALSTPTLTNLQLETACTVNAGYNSTICDAIITGVYRQENFVDEMGIVQRYIAGMNSWTLIIQSLVTVFSMLSLASCSDYYRLRKPFLLLPIIGYGITYVGYIVCANYKNKWPVEVLGFIEAVIPSLFGNNSLLTTIIFAYITDANSIKTRTLHLGIIQALCLVCYSLGQYLTAMFLSTHYYNSIFLAALILCLFTFFYGMINIDEPEKLSKEVNLKSVILKIFDPQNIIEPFKLFPKYKGIRRINIICILILACIHSMIIHGENTVLFLYTQAAYEWTVKDFSLLTVVKTIIDVIGLTFVIPLFTKILNLSDLATTALSFLNKMISNSIIVLVHHTIGLYIGTIIYILSTVVRISILSQLTKLVQEDDVCKILALCLTTDAIGTSSALYIYNKVIYVPTQNKFPQAFFLLGIVLSLIAVIIIVCLYVVTSKEKHIEDKQRHD